MKKNIFIYTFKFLFGTIILSMAAGCVTYDTAVKETRLQEDMNVLRENITRIKGNIETVDMEYRRLNKEYQKLQEDINRTSETISKLNRNYEQLSKTVNQLQSARKKDREIIIEQLTATITEMLQKQDTTARTPSSMTGYEHQIKSGETLSEIAEAYDVTVEAIMQENNLSDPNLVRSGQILFIPE
jgi:LysM repeat protein